jgi:hypothetical protein
MAMRIGQIVIAPTELRDQDVQELEHRLIEVLNGGV